MKMKLLKKIGVISVFLCMGFICACGKKEDQDVVKVEIEKIDEVTDEVQDTPATETPEVVVDNENNQLVPGQEKSAIASITPGAQITEEQMKKIVEEQKSIEGNDNFMNPDLKNNGPADLQPNFGPSGFDENYVLENGNKDPNLKPNFPSPGVELEKQPVIDLKPNFPSDGQNGPTPIN